ncbi:MAG: NAD-dependent epimerase/dehydratase family protein [Phycisphaerales bacterium]|nr:NAD-dependent epimerase/dehydratase family protein [Phycisphaerales bacterium]
MQRPEFVEAYRGSAVLITGGAGFIGSHLALALARLGARVRVLDDLSGGFEANLDEARAAAEAAGAGRGGVELARASVLDGPALREAVKGCRYVYHQAAMVSVPQSVEQPERCMQLNVGGTERVLEEAKAAGVRRVMFAASAAAYGNHPSLPSREEHLPDCWSPYAASKVAGELLLRTFSRCYGLGTVALRYFNIFGPRQDPNSPYAAVITAFARALIAGRQPRIMGDGEQTRDFTYIDNVVYANLLAGASPRELTGDVVNIGTGSRIRLLDVLSHMGRVLGVDATPAFAEPRPGDVRHSTADIARARELLGYEPVVDFGEGIARTLAWAKDAWKA